MYCLSMEISTINSIKTFRSNQQQTIDKRAITYTIPILQINKNSFVFASRRFLASIAQHSRHREVGLRPAHTISTRQFSFERNNTTHHVNTFSDWLSPNVSAVMVAALSPGMPVCVFHMIFLFVFFFGNLKYWQYNNEKYYFKNKIKTYVQNELPFEYHLVPM